MKISRELAWLAGCAAVATGFCFYAPEYGYSPVPFFTGALYVAVGAARLVLRVIRKYAN